MRGRVLLLARPNKLYGLPALRPALRDLLYGRHTMHWRHLRLVNELPLRHGLSLVLFVVGLLHALVRMLAASLTSTVLPLAFAQAGGSCAQVDCSTFNNSHTVTRGASTARRRPPTARMACAHQHSTTSIRHGVLGSFCIRTPAVCRINSDPAPACARTATLAAQTARPTRPTAWAANVVALLSISMW